MSYCRWSSNNWRCDLYCYEDCYGRWVTHVANNRVVGDVPELPNILETPTAKWMRAYRKQHRFLATAGRKPIGLPYDGESFDDPDLESFLARLLELRDLGYNFPDYVIEEVKAELAEVEIKD